MPIYSPTQQNKVSFVTAKKTVQRATYPVVETDNFQQDLVNRLPVSIPSSGTHVVVNASPIASIDVQNLIVSSNAGGSFKIKSGTNDVTGLFHIGANQTIEIDSDTILANQNESLIIDSDTDLGGAISYKLT